MTQSDVQASRVTKANVIDKVSYVVFGSSRRQDRQALRAELLSFLRVAPERIVTRQAINGWFLDKHPARARSLEYLLKYLKQRVSGNRIDARRAETYDQLIVFARNRWGFSTDLKQLYTDVRRIYFTDRGKVTISVGVGNNDRLRSSLKMEGVYFIYHSRLTEDYRGHFTQEVMEIDHKGRFKLWYLRDETQVEQYNGILFLFGNMLWFFGSTNSDPDRLRTMNFKFIASKNHRYHEIRWGMMLGDMPSSYEPMSCRVVLYKIKERIENVHRFAEDNVRNFLPEDAFVGRNKIITRLISNQTTALSSYESSFAAPAKDNFGYEIRDHVLKVNEDTIYRVCDYLNSSEGGN